MTHTDPNTADPDLADPDLAEPDLAEPGDLVDLTEVGDPTAPAGPPPLGIPTELETPLGTFPAVSGGGVVRVRNVRYATARRFEAPVPAEVRPDEAADRRFQRIACPQPPSPSDELLGRPLRGVEFDEDCLRLSITLPEDAPDEPMPVLVWVHGGSHVSGAGDLAGYDPAAIVREQRVVVVGVTSRLGLLGYPTDDAHPANLGLLDLIAAFRWVGEHIGAFGGDPERITAVGQSSGGDALAHLIAADGARGLFRRVVLQSPPLGIRTGRAEMQQRMAAAAGPLDPEASLDDLFAAQARAKQAAAGSGLRSAMPFGPRAGAAPLPAEGDVEAAWREHAADLDVLVTWNRDETAFFFEVDPKLAALAARPVVGSWLRRLIVARTTNAVYRSGARRFARIAGRGGADVRVAEFDGHPDGSRIGSAHAIEVALLFPATEAWTGTPLLAPDGARTLVAAGAALRAAWAEFGRDGAFPAGYVPTGHGWAGSLLARRV
ncbi:carboxylic ester hydrolase [Agromyces luteolus]|uniref:Carboxylesterase family protein n=1 Tax=Agromyces luteolus TaxID=88373 RepID=A0A7C9LEM3_9MICO|nr:carboxylesterase family protein [Agromyces luteolus]MUN08131.1 carboxylesterase family protein [Agromyces luteolus]GLK27852.1 carboxylic ester hydrolase [Agromyces luteolus]